MDSRLRRIIEEETESPGAYPHLLEELAEEFPDRAALFRFLAAKDDHHRHSFYIKSQHVWYRRFGWRIMRPLFILALLAGVVFSLQKVIDPVVGVLCFLAGAGAFYAIFQIFAHRWAYRDLKKLDEVNLRYRQRLGELKE